MADRILGLVGSGEGPRVCTRDLCPEPIARITGLTEGGEVSIEHENGTVLTLYSNGHHPICSSDYVRVSSKGSPKMICTLLSGRKRAVS